MTTRNLILIPVLLLALAMIGCGALPSSDSRTPEAAGARLWGATCNRCHNFRPPRQFTAEQWPIIVNHMRTRANLTRSEAAAIATYLQRLSAGESE